MNRVLPGVSSHLQGQIVLLLFPIHAQRTYIPILQSVVHLCVCEGCSHEGDQGQLKSDVRYPVPVQQPVHRETDGENGGDCVKDVAVFALSEAYTTPYSDTTELISKSMSSLELYRQITFAAKRVCMVV